MRRTGCACTLRADGGQRIEQLSTHKYLTVPEPVHARSAVLHPAVPVLLFARDNVAGAAFLLGGLGATDWVDGWLARRFNQVSEFGKMFDPTADRLLFIVGISGIIVKGIPPLWFFWLVVIREVVVRRHRRDRAPCCSSMKRFDVTWWGKTATFLLMFAIPGFMLGATDFPLHQAFLVAAWLLGDSRAWRSATTRPSPTSRRSARAFGPGVPRRG